MHLVRWMNVNKVVQQFVIVHLPTNIIEMQEERTQQKNRESHENHPCA